MQHTGQESGGELCKSFKFWSFLQSKFVKCLQIASASGGLCHQPPCWGFVHGRYWGTPWTIAPLNENSWCHQFGLGQHPTPGLGKTGEVGFSEFYNIYAQMSVLWIA